MKQIAIRAATRELWVTAAVRAFLSRYGSTDSARELSEDIARALDGRDPKNGYIRLSAPTFLLFIADGPYPGGRDRVIVWHGPSDGGAFFSNDILERTAPWCEAD